jgi:3-oxoacyl-[acyl-carrier-protein] synthase-1
MRDKRGRRMGACVTPGFPALHLSGYARLVELGAKALAQVAPSKPIAVMLALAPPGRPDDDPRLDEELLVDMAARARVRLDAQRSQVFRAGHAAGALAMEAAVGLVEQGLPVLVGGVDSWVHADLLRWLDDECRLHALGAEDGFIPSEGAAFALLAPSDRTTSMWVRGVKTAREETVLGDEPNLAAAMTAMVHAFCDAAEPRVAWVMSDVNGERARIREWSMVELRASFDTPLLHMRLPDLLGDVGAASAAMALVLSETWWRAGCAPAGRALVVLHSDGAERGAMELEAVTQG